MANSSNIEWTDATWSTVTGCTRVSPGCQECYSERLTATRLAHLPKYKGLAVLNTKGEARWTGEVRLHPEALDEPIRWKKPRRIFVCSMSDLFHEGVPFEFIDKVFAVMALCRRHVFQVLTKRPERMREYIARTGRSIQYLDDAARTLGYSLRFEMDGKRIGLTPWPLPGVWLGTSVEDQQRADERIPELLKCPAAVRFLSCEPLLGPLDLSKHFQGLNISRKMVRDPYASYKDAPRVDSWGAHCAVCGEYFGGQVASANGPGHRYAETMAHQAIRQHRESCHPIHWSIVGDESGPNRRRADPAWHRSLRDQCRTAGVAFFEKQIEVDGKISKDIGTFPADLRIREFPATAAPEPAGR